MQAGFILSLVFAILIAVFALKNGDPVTVDFLFADIEVSQAIVIFVSAALGAIIVTILGLIRQVKLSLKVKDQSKKISNLENDKNILENRINELLSEISNSSKNDNTIDFLKNENNKETDGIVLHNNEENNVE